MRVVLSANRKIEGDALRRVLLGEGLECEAADMVSYDALPSRLATINPGLVLIHAENGPAAIAAIQSAHQVTNAPILACGDVTNAEHLRAVIRAGAKEYLAIDRIREELAESILQIGAPVAADDEPGKLIAMYSPNGGVGVSNTAVNLAARLVKKMPEQIALADLNTAPSDMALMLDIEPKHTAGDVLQNWQRLDRQMLTSAMTKHRTGLNVLPQAGYTHAGPIADHSHDPAAIRQLLILLRRAFPISVLDLPHTLGEAQIEAMKLSSCVGLVVRADIPGLARARWALETAEQRGVPRDRFRLVLNRYGRSASMKVDQIEQMLGISLVQSIPEDGASVCKAVNEGVTVAELSKLSKISRSFSSFARNIEMMG